MRPRFGNSWKKGNASLQEYGLRDTRYYEVCLISVDLFGEELRALLNSRVLVGATYNVTHNTYSSRARIYLSLIHI